MVSLHIVGASQAKGLPPAAMRSRTALLNASVNWRYLGIVARSDHFFWNLSCPGLRVSYS